MDEFGELADYAGLTTSQVVTLIGTRVTDVRKRYPTLPTGEDALKRCAVDLLSLVFLITELNKRHETTFAKVVDGMAEIVALLQGEVDE